METNFSLKLLPGEFFEARRERQSADPNQFSGEYVIDIVAESLSKPGTFYVKHRNALRIVTDSAHQAAALVDFLNGVGPLKNFPLDK